MNWTCNLGIHNWNSWRVSEEGSLVHKTGIIIGKYIYQIRECKDCNKTEIKEETTRGSK